MATSYPPTAFNFKVEFGLDGIQDNDSRFQEVSGLGPSYDVEEIREGGENRYVHRLPNAVKHSNLILKRGLISDSTILAWIKGTLEGGFSTPIKPVDIIVTLINDLNEPLASWKVEKAYPVKFTTAGFNANSNEVVIESIEFAYSKFTRED